MKDTDKPNKYIEPPKSVLIQESFGNIEVILPPIVATIITIFIIMGVSK